MTHRRDFLKSLGIAGVGATLLSQSAALAVGSAVSKPSDSQTATDNPDALTTVSILQTTDVHCQIHSHDELFWENGKAVFRKTGGYANLAGKLNRLKKSNPNSFTIDTGDMFQGSELSVATTGRALVPILNAMDYDLYLPGNWEVVFGKKNMQQLMGSLTGPKVCTNMYHDLGHGQKGELIFQPYTIWKTAGIKIAFLGYTDPMVPKRQSPSYSEGILYTKPEENLAHYVEVLKNQEKCAYIILLSHLGLSQQIALANREECKGVDYILGGDTHERVRKPIVCKYAKVVEPGAFGSFIGKLDLTVQYGKVVKDHYELVEVDGVNTKPDAKVNSIISQIEQPYLEEINQVIGYSTIPLYRYFVVENPIDTLILEGLHWKFPEIDIVLSNGFRFCPPNATPDKTGNIPITNGFLYDMLPVDSTIRKGKVTGIQLREWLENELNNVFAKDAERRFGGWLIKFKGMEITFDAFGDEGKRLKSVTVKGASLDNQKTYTIMACEREGDPEDMLCRMKHVKETQNTAATLHSALKDYLKANSPVTPTPPLAAKILDAPQHLLSQVSGVDYTFS